MADKKKQNDYSAYQEYVNKRNNITPEQYMEYAVNRQGIGQRMAEKRVNNLNNILSNDYLANLGNGQYKTPLQTYQTKRMARDAWLAYDSAAEYLRAVYGRDAASGLNSYARYIKQLNDAAKSEASFYGQFAGQQDYNERYAYPQTVKGKTDAEIEAMMDIKPKTRNMLNKAAAFGKGNGSSTDDAYLTWLNDYFNNKTVTGIDRQIAANQGLLDANKAKQEEINNRVYDPQKWETSTLAPEVRKQYEDDLAWYNAQEYGPSAYERFLQEQLDSMGGKIQAARAAQYQDSKDQTFATYQRIEEIDAIIAADDQKRRQYDVMGVGLADAAAQRGLVLSADERAALEAERAQLEAKAIDQENASMSAGVLARGAEYAQEYDEQALYSQGIEYKKLLDEEVAKREQREAAWDEKKREYETILAADKELALAAGRDRFGAQNARDLESLVFEQNDLEFQNAILNAKREEVVARSKYNDLAAAPDFKTLSVYDSSNGDSLYQFINEKGTSQEQGAAPVFGMGEFAGAVDVSEANNEAAYQAAGYTFLLPEEVLAYDYIYKKEDRDKAQEFLDSFRNIRLARARSKESEEWAKYAEEYGVWASVVSLGTNLVSGLMYPLQAIDAKFNPNHSQFSGLYSSNIATNVIRDVRGQAWSKWLSDEDGNPKQFMGADLGNGIYQTIMGMGDMLVAMGAGKVAGLATGSGFARGLTQFIMSSEAGSSALLNNLQRGLSADKAVGMSVASAMIEALTEKYSIDALLKEPKKAALYIAKNMLTEGSEEAASSLANTLVDLIVNADQAELAQAIAEKGYAQALTEYAQSVGLDAIMGAISGGVMGGGSVAVNKGVQAYHTKQTGKQINTNQTYKQLHDIAVAMPEGSKARKIASGKEKLNNRKAGQLYNALMEELDTKSQETIRSTMTTEVKNRLRELGTTDNLDEAAEAIQKLWMGGKLSAREQNIIAQTPNALQVQKEVLEWEDGWVADVRERNAGEQLDSIKKRLEVQQLASKGYRAENEQVSKALADNASTTFANASEEKGLNSKAYTEDGTTVEIKRIEEHDGKPVFVVDQGGQEMAYAIGDLHLDSYNTSALVNPLRNAQMSASAANILYHSYPTSGLGAADFARAFQIAYNAGTESLGMPYVDSNTYTRILSPETRKAAYDAGRKDAKPGRKAPSKKTGSVTFTQGVDQGSLTDNQWAAIEAAKHIAPLLGVDIVFFESKANAEGKYTQANGAFHDNTLYLDVHAGRNNAKDVTEFAILRTMSHELTHYIAANDKQAYRELQDFVVTHLTEKGKSISDLVDEKKARENRKMSDAAALEEVVADACEMMLKNTTAIETLARENATLFEKIADWIRGFLDKLRKAFDGVEATHAEARALEGLDELQKLWDKALVNAARAEGTQDGAESAGEGAKFSARGGGLLNGEEAKRLESNWNDYKYSGYQFTERPNGGIMVSMGNLIVYTHPTGDPEYVLEIDDDDNVGYVEESNKIYDRMTQLEKDGVRHEIQRQALQSMVRSVGAHFRSRKSYNAATDNSEGRRGRYPGKNSAGVGGKVSPGRKVSVKRSIFFPSRFNRLFDQYLAKVQTPNYNPANFRPGEFTTMRIGDDVLLLKRRTENDFGLSAHFGVNVGSRLTNERFENKRFNTRADALTWLNGLKNENGKPLLFKSNWEPTSKKMFSVREPVERAKDMIAMHNIGGDAMMQFIKNGRLYWPSVAVVNDKAKFDSFGEYSLLFAPWQFGEDWDDPESAPLTERFRMYGSDAYTPSLPQEVANALQKGEDTFRSMYGEWGTDPASVDDYIETLYGSRFNHGFPGSIRANTAKRYSSIEAMKQDRGRLISDGPTHDTMSISKELDERRNDLILRIWDKNGGSYGSYSNFRYEKYAGFENDLLLNVLDTVEDGKYMDEYGQQLEVIIDYAKERGIKLDRPLAKGLLQLFEAVANDVVGYFEIKFSRNVNGTMDSGYPQVIVAPDNLPDAIREYAKETGIGLYTYKAGDSDSRRDVVNEAADLEGMKFSVRDTDTISSREILANADPNAFKQTTAQGFLVDYQKAYQELVKLNEKLVKYQKAAAGDLTPEEKYRADNRAQLAREQVIKQENKLSKMESKPEFAQVLATERLKLQAYVGSKSAEQIANTIRKYEAKIEALGAIEKDTKEKAKKARQLARSLYKQRNRWIKEGDALNLARKLVQENSSTLKATELAPRLRGIFERMANETGDGYVQAANELNRIAGEIVANAQAYAESGVSYVGDYLNGKAIRLTDTQKQEVRSAYGTLAEFRRQTKLNITDKGTDLTQLWGELNGMNPVLFDAQATEGDMVYALASAMEAAQPEVYNPFAGSEREAAAEIAADLLDEGTALTVHLPAIEAQKKHYQSVIATLKSDSAQKLAAANARGRERLEKYREKTKDTLTRSALRDRIRHDVKTLNRLLLNETDTKHVPEELKGAVAQFLTVFTQDSSVFDQKKLDDLRYAYGKISDRNAANEDLPDISAQYDWDIANMMDDLREILPGRRLSELTQEETRKIRDIVQHFKFIVKESSRLFFFDKSRDIASAGQRFIEDTDQQKKYNGPDGAVANMLRGGMITPSYFFKKLGGVAKELFDDLKQGESTYGLRVAQARKFFDDVAEKYHYDDWRNVKDDVLTLTTQQGHTITLTREQALGLYATWNRENSENGQNASHLSEGGFVYEEAMKKDKKTGKIEVDTSRPHKMTDKDMQQVANWLTDEQRAYADAMVDYMSKDMAKLGNEVSMKLFGIEKYGEEKYYPYQTSKNFRYTALGAAAATNDQRLKHSSFTHRVTKMANNPIIAADFTTVWENHVNHMLLYSSMCVPLENFNRVYNYKYTDEDGNHSVKQSLINAYGSSAQKYIEQLMHDLNGGVAVQSDGVMDQLISKFKKNAVYASASVVVQQPSAMVRAMALVNPKYFAGGVMKDGSWDELTRYSGVAVIKEMGGFDTSTGFGAQDWITGERRKTKLETFSKKADDIASFLPERADRLAWVAIWKAVKAEVADNTSLEGEELLQAAAKRFDEVIGYTQVYDSTLSKSQMMRNKHLNAVTAFMAEPTVTYNLLVDAFTNRGKADSVNPARAVAAFTATAIVNAMLKSLVTAARDDEEKNYLEKYAGEFVENVTSDLNPLNLIPYARDIVSIMQGYDVERADMSLISDLYKGVKRGIESAKDGDWYTMAKEFAGPISGLVGLPVKNVWRDIEAVFNAIHSIGTPMTPGGMKYSILEALPFYGSTPTDYYSRRLDAMLEGDASELESLTMHLETGLGKAAKTVKSKTKEELGKRYKAGKIGDAEATDILMDYFEMDADEAYWQLKEWREKEAHKDEDDYSFSRTDDLKEALLSGKTAQIEAAKTELAGVGGYTDKEVTGKAKSAIKSLYVDGQITLDKAMKLLQDQAGDMTKDDLYWTEQEWAYDKANPDGEWNKYMKVHEAIKAGKGAKEAAKELLAHGVEKGDAAKVIANKWKETYVTLYRTDRKAALDLHARILDMYVALGYSRSYQVKYIKDHWFE